MHNCQFCGIFVRQIVNYYQIRELNLKCSGFSQVLTPKGWGIIFKSVYFLISRCNFIHTHGYIMEKIWFSIRRSVTSFSVQGPSVVDNQWFQDLYQTVVRGLVKLIIFITPDTRASWVAYSISYDLLTSNEFYNIEIVTYNKDNKITQVKNWMNKSFMFFLY